MPSLLPPRGSTVAARPFPGKHTLFRVQPELGSTGHFHCHSAQRHQRVCASPCLNPPGPCFCLAHRNLLSGFSHALTAWAPPGSSPLSHFFQDISGARRLFLLGARHCSRYSRGRSRQTWTMAVPWEPPFSWNKDGF